VCNLTSKLFPFAAEKISSICKGANAVFSQNASQESAKLFFVINGIISLVRIFIY